MESETRSTHLVERPGSCRPSISIPWSPVAADGDGGIAAATVTERVRADGGRGFRTELETKKVKDADAQDLNINNTTNNAT